MPLFKAFDMIAGKGGAAVTPDFTDLNRRLASIDTRIGKGAVHGAVTEAQDKRIATIGGQGESNLARQGASNQATAMSNAALMGGASQGTFERLGRQSMRDLAEGQQSLAGNLATSRAEAGLQDIMQSQNWINQAMLALPQFEAQKVGMATRAAQANEGAKDLRRGQILGLAGGAAAAYAGA